MRFNVNEIPPEGLDLSEEADLAKWDIETSQIKFKGPLSLTAHIDRQKDDIFASVHARGTTVRGCSRCLADFPMPLRLDKIFLYSARGRRVVNMDSDIREEIMLDYPIQSLCKPTCEGLCPVCGKNLNEGVCNCKSHLENWNKKIK